MREKFVRLQQIGTLLNLDHVRPHFVNRSIECYADGRSVFDPGETGRRRGRVFQRFWDHVEVERAGG